MKRPTPRETYSALTRRSAQRAIIQRQLFGQRMVLALVMSLVLIVVSFVYLDPIAVVWQRGLPAWFIWPFEYTTHLGWSGLILYPIAFALIVLFLLDRLDLGRSAHGTIAALALRLALVFVAIAGPGLFIAIVKRVIGRLRPPAFEVSGHLTFDPLAWTAHAASFPSGHATTAFGAAVVLGALWPWARAPLFVLAALVALSRVVIGTHFVSDVVGGAVFGSIAAALIVRAFAARRWALKVAPDGTIQPMPGPSARRLAALAGSIEGALVRGTRFRKRA